MPASSRAWPTFSSCSAGACITRSAVVAATRKRLHLSVLRIHDACDLAAAAAEDEAVFPPYVTDREVRDPIKIVCIFLG